VIYGEVEPHVGHCDAANGVKAGMPVLAPLIAEIWPANTLLAVSLDDKTTFGFQILNGIMFDDVVGSPDEIRTWFDGLVGDHKWEHSSSPWGVGDHQKTSLMDSLGDRRLKTPKLRSVNESRGALFRIGLIVMVGLILFLAVSKIIQNRREMAARLAMFSRHVVRNVIPPARIVPIGPFVAACKDALNRIPADPAGWDVKSVSCRSDRLRIVWRRDSGGGGTIRDLESVLGSKVELEGSHAVRSDFPLSVSESRVPVDRLPDLIEEKKDFISVLERYGLRYGMDNGSILPGASSGPGEGSGFSVDLPDLPEGRLLSDLSNVAGLSVDALEWAGKSQWILKGDLKHAPIAFQSKRIPSGTPAFVSPGVGPGGNRKPAPASSGKSSGSGRAGQRETLQPPGRIVRQPGAESGASGRGKNSRIPSVHFPPGN
jgi:hypothetical protein